MFNGFPPQVFDFLKGLHQHPHPDWFAQHRETYEKIVKPTVKEFISAVAPFIHILNPHLETAPKFNKTIGRLHNDTRFHKNKPPYKKYLFITFPREGGRWSDAPFLYLALHRSGVYVGYWSGAAGQFYPEDWQKRLRTYSARFREFLERNDIRENYFQMEDAGEDGPGRLAALPEDVAGWAQLTDVSVGVFYPREEPVLRSKEFLRRVATHFFDLYPLYIFQTSNAIEADLSDYYEKKQGFRFLE